jgi:hypothetical protein
LHAGIFILPRKLTYSDVSCRAGGYDRAVTAWKVDVVLWMC